MGVAVIRSWMCYGVIVGPITVGYRRRWRKCPFYYVQNRKEISRYAGIGPLYVRWRS